MKRFLTQSVISLVMITVALQELNGFVIIVNSEIIPLILVQLHLSLYTRMVPRDQTNISIFLNMTKGYIIVQVN